MAIVGQSLLQNPARLPGKCFMIWSFNAAKIIRSHKRMTDAEIYALIKLSRSVENPTHAKIQRLLKSAVKYRETMHWPLTARPLGVLPLAHSSFNSDGERWLKQVIQDFKYLFPSFHVPRSNLREVPHQSIKKFLHNFRSWEETMWDPAFQLDSVKCSCSNFQQVLPDQCFVDGHVAAGLEQFDRWLGQAIARALPGPAQPVRFSLPKQVGSHSLCCCLTNGSNGTDFPKPCDLFLKRSVKHSGLFIFKLLKKQTG